MRLTPWVKVGGLFPGSCSPHAEVSLTRTLNPKSPWRFHRSVTVSGWQSACALITVLYELRDSPSYEHEPNVFMLNLSFEELQQFNEVSTQWSVQRVCLQHTQVIFFTFVFYLKFQIISLIWRTDDKIFYEHMDMYSLNCARAITVHIFAWPGPYLALIFRCSNSLPLLHLPFSAGDLSTV